MTKKLVIYTNGYFFIDTFIFEDDGNAELEENFSADDFYWCELEKPDTGNEE
ncbi:hypothetical protein [Streptococcus dysgalactiae]|uniref:hypothetical protein n=1 Tax=Streptococcus dysgalactiae TaxID=1334 RepID=UPI0024B69635|nr:hypothetical protein [Streptococcus dysgalactiae]